MKIYIAHSKYFDYKKELYEILRKSELNKKHEIILPHENSDNPYSTKELFKNSCDLIIAEVSIPSTGVGIELGWADSLNIPILAINKKSSKISSSIKILTKNIIEYENKEDLIKKIAKFLN